MSADHVPQPYTRDFYRQLLLSGKKASSALYSLNAR